MTGTPHSIPNYRDEHFDDIWSMLTAFDVHYSINSDAEIDEINKMINMAWDSGINAHQTAKEILEWISTKSNLKPE